MTTTQNGLMPLLLKTSQKVNVFRILYTNGSLTAKEITNLLYSNRDWDKNLKNVRVYLNRLEIEDELIEKQGIKDFEMVYGIREDFMWYGGMTKKELIIELKESRRMVSLLEDKIREITESDELVNKIITDLKTNDVEKEWKEKVESLSPRAITIMKEIKDSEGFVDYEKWTEMAGMERISDAIVDIAIEQLFEINPDHFIEITKHKKYQYLGN